MLYKKSLKLESNHRAVSLHDITDSVKEIVKESNEVVAETSVLVVQTPWFIIFPVGLYFLTGFS